MAKRQSNPISQEVRNLAVTQGVKLAFLASENKRITTTVGKTVKLWIDENDAEDLDAMDDEGMLEVDGAARWLVGQAKDFATVLAEIGEHASVYRDEDTRDFVLELHNNEAARDPNLADLMASIEEGVEEPDGEDGEEESDKGSVVPEKYKKRYAENSPDRKVDCGDWLADQLAKFCLVPVVDGKKKTMTDLDRFEDICTSNGVDAKKMSALRTGRPGWQGRFRMTGRNLLTPIVAAKGVLFVPQGHGADADMEVKAPKAWCLDNAPKPKAERKTGKGSAVETAKPKAKKPAKAKAKKAPAKRARKTKAMEEA